MKRRFMVALICGMTFLTPFTLKASQQQDVYEIQDPYEGFNRVMFKFNEKLDKYILIPAAEGYRAITTPYARERVRNFFSNMKEPVSAVNQILQGEFKNSGISLSRFVINSTLGLAGTHDVAGAWGLKKNQDGFDETLAKWGVPSGSYLVLPFVGPTTPRAFAGTIADGFISPVYWVTEDHEDGAYAYVAYVGAKAVVDREALLDYTRDLEKNSVDYYATMKAAYIQNKQKNYHNSSDNNTVSYDFDFEEVEYEEVIYTE